MNTHPTKWSILATRENHAELNRWRLSKRTSEASKWDDQFVPGSFLVSEHPFDGSYFFLDDWRPSESSYQEITLEKFREITNPKPMKHPEKWYIPVTEENQAELQSWWQTKAKGSPWSNSNLLEGRLLLSEHPTDSSGYWAATEESFTNMHPSYQKITLEQFRQITNTQPMKHPEHWCIEATDENFKELFAWWRNTASINYTNFQVGHTLMSEHPTDRSNYYSSYIAECLHEYPQFVEITLEQFRQITNSQFMKHPEKWYIPVTKDNHAELNRWRQRVATSHRDGILHPYESVILSAHHRDGSYYYASDAKGLKANGAYIDYQEITLEQFRQITNPNQNQTPMSKQIRISRELLNEYYEASTNEQKDYLTEHFKLDGTTTVEAIRGLHDMACERWKPKIKKNHPDCFPITKYFDFSKHANKSEQGKKVVSKGVCESLGLVEDFIQVRNSCNQELDQRSFYLTTNYNWELVQDDRVMVLVPTKKSSE